MKAWLLGVACMGISACTPGNTEGNTRVEAGTADAGAVDAGTVDGGAVDAGPSPGNLMVPASLPAFLDCLRARGFAIAEAHRGGNEPGYAENALETLIHALETAPAALEVDIARTSDGALVLMHDDTVDRTTTGTGNVADMTLAELQALRLKDNNGQVLDAHPPTLQAVLDWSAGKTILFLDTKPSVSLAEVVAAVRVANAENRVVIITYSRTQAAAVYALEPSLVISATVSRPSDLEGLLARGLDPTRLVAWTSMTQPDAALNQFLAENGVEAMFGTLGEVDSWDQRFVDAGQDRYAEFAATGLQLIGTDRYAAAARDLDAHDGVDGHGYKQCEGAR